MSEHDRILMCPECCTRQNFNFGGSGKVGVLDMPDFRANKGGFE